jgi:hypothetical protein
MIQRGRVIDSTPLAGGRFLIRAKVGAATISLYLTKPAEPGASITVERLSNVSGGYRIANG